MKKRSHTFANCVAYVALLCGVAYAWPWVLDVSPSVPGVGGSPAIGSLPPTVVAQGGANSGSKDGGESRSAEDAGREAASDAGASSDDFVPDEPVAPPKASLPRPKAPVYPSGYVQGGEVIVDVPAADDAAAILLERQLATLSDGSCIDFGQWREVMPRNVIPDGTCARYRTVVEEPGEVAVSVADNVIRRDDSPPPPPQVLISEDSANAHAAGDTLFYRDAEGEAGTFIVAVVAADPESGVEQVTFPALGDDESRSQFGSDAGVSYAWRSDASGPREGVVVLMNGAGSTSEAPVQMVGDEAPPAAGFVSYADTLHRDGGVEVTVDNGEDAISGVDDASGVLEQQDVRLLSGRCRGGWSSWHPAAPNGSQERAVCVRFRYRVSDNVGNEAMFTSSRVAKVVDQVRPTIALVAPREGATVNGAVLVAAEASDIGFGVAAVRLEFSRAGGCNGGWRLIATTTTAPYAATWETSSLAPGRYRVRALVTDRAGNRSVSGAVVVRIPAPPEPPEDDDEPGDDKDEPTEPDDDDDDVAESAADAAETPPAEPEQSETELRSEDAGTPAETSAAEPPPESEDDGPDITSP